MSAGTPEPYAGDSQNSQSETTEGLTVKHTEPARVTFAALAERAPYVEDAEIALDEIDCLRAEVARLESERERLIGVLRRTQKQNDRLVWRNSHLWTLRKQTKIQRNNDEYRAATCGLPPALVQKAIVCAQLEAEDAEGLFTAEERALLVAVTFDDAGAGVGGTA